MFRHRDEVVHGLVSLPCALFSTTASFIPRANGPVTVVGSDPAATYPKARRAAELALHELGRPDLGGTVILLSTTPRSRGLGSSTSDVLATMRAVADATEARLSPQTQARLAVLVEGSVDSVMFAEPALFGHLSGHVLRQLPGPLPWLRVVGFDFRPQAPGVDTLSFQRPRYTAADIREFGRLYTNLHHAVATSDATLVAQVATGSTIIEQTYHPDPLVCEVLTGFQAYGAAGVQVAHSGTVAGLIFDPVRGDVRRSVGQALRWLSSIGIDDAYTFDVGDARCEGIGSRA